jgi:hypothetical protein
MSPGRRKPASANTSAVTPATAAPTRGTNNSRRTISNDRTLALAGVALLLEAGWVKWNSYRSHDTDRPLSWMRCNPKVAEVLISHFGGRGDWVPSPNKPAAGYYGWFLTAEEELDLLLEVFPYMIQQHKIRLAVGSIRNHLGRPKRAGEEI